MAKVKATSGLRAVSVADFRKAMKATNTKEISKDTAILVAKELGYQIRQKRTLSSVLMKMRLAQRQGD